MFFQKKREYLSFQNACVLVLMFAIWGGGAGLIITQRSTQEGGGGCKNRINPWEQY